MVTTFSLTDKTADTSSWLTQITGPDGAGSSSTKFRNVEQVRKRRPQTRFDVLGAPSQSQIIDRW
jgi:hypothetical protein